MINSRSIFIKTMNSTLWIAVLVVHVGCIIEVQPSKYTSSGSSSLLPLTSGSRSQHQEDTTDHDQLTPAASQSVVYTTFGKNNYIHDNTHRVRTLSSSSNRGPKLVYSSTSTPSPTTKTTGKNDANNVDVGSQSGANVDDTCTKKLDGYYQNFGSDCSSYYFCAAGYQITYVCPPGERYTGKRCEEDYKCPKKPGFINVCGTKPNGYYAFPNGNPGKYFYCFQKAKVIELECDLGKVFIHDKCTFPKLEKVEGEQTITSLTSLLESGKSTKTNTNMALQSGSLYGSADSGNSRNSDINSNGGAEVGAGDESCSESNGFYPDKRTGCKKYYYCIGGEKTELSCQTDFLFNGDICVHSSRYTCPYTDQRDV